MELVEITTRQRVERPQLDLASLSSVELNEAHSVMLAAVNSGMHLPGVYRARMEREARDVLALAQVAPPGRLRIEWLDITEEELRVLMFMQVVAPCKPDENNQLRFAQHVVLGLIYSRDAIQRALPGTSFFDVVQPFDLWHPNVSPIGPIPISRLCLGPEMMPGIRCVDLILMAYGALSMQSLQIDERDSAGVMNVAAAEWWQQNTHRLPLTTTPFLKGDDASETEQRMKGH